MIYVDPQFRGPMIRGNTLWCHMGTDDHSPEGMERFHAFARKLGLRREWFQKDNKHHLHYDLFPARRVAAIKAGAVEVDQKTYVLKCSTYPSVARKMIEEA